jgi:hypothetical protein
MLDNMINRDQTSIEYIVITTAEALQEEGEFRLLNNNNNNNNMYIIFPLTIEEE